jgi:RNA polymerase sigma factor (sigma-70 family)
MTAETEALAENNVRLVYHMMAKLYPVLHKTAKWNCMDEEDLLNEGLWALYRAAEGYNPRVGKFSTYACVAISRSIRRAATGYKREDVALHTLSLDEDECNGEYRALYEKLEDESAARSFWEVVEGSVLRREVREAVDALTPRQREAVRRRYGLGYIGKTYPEIAADMGCKPQNVKQLVALGEASLRIRLAEWEESV